MKLVVHELDTEMSQRMTVRRNMQLVAVRPHIYRHNVPSGSLKVQVCDANGSLIKESNTVDISNIGSLAYFHGYVTFDVEVQLRKNTEYIFKIVAGDGYSFSESAYCGVCNDYDLQKYDKGYSVLNSRYASLDIEFWEKTRK